MTEQREPLILRQYETKTCELSSELARRIAVEAGSALTVSPTAEAGSWGLTPSNYVGSMVISGQPILIRPKIPPENVFVMLEVGIPDKQWRRELFGFERSPDLLVATISWFARQVEMTLGRGVLRSYMQHEERLVAMRGRVDINGVFRQPGLALPVPCRFDEFTADIPENRYVRAAILLALRVSGVPSQHQQRLRRELARLEEVSDVRVHPADLDRMKFNRLNQRYRPMLNLARLILQNLTLVDRAGSVRASSFLIDMNQLFEEFVAKRLKEELAGRLSVETQTRRHLGEGKKVLMKPDLEFSRDDRTVYVGDTKYKLTETADAKSSDYYQMLAYCTALSLDEGMLIYCSGVSGELEGDVTVKRSGQRLVTYALDLSGSPDEIGSQLTALADRIHQRVVALDRRHLQSVS